MAEDASFEQLLSLVGGEGAWQRRLLARCSLAALLMGLHSLATVVQAATPRHWCALPAELSRFQLTTDQYVPRVSAPDGRRLPLSCSMFNLSVSQLDGALHNSSGTVPCAQLEFDTAQYGRTAAVQWQLVCARAMLVAAVQSSFMLAVLVGFLLSGLLSDLYGRRSVAWWSGLLTPLASLAVAAAPSLEAFIVLRALLGLTLPGLFGSLMVLCLETVGPPARGVYGILFQVPVDLGLALTAAAGLVTASWWQLQLVLSVPALLLPLLLCTLPESPRWLLSRGRLREAAAVLELMAAGNGRTPPPRAELLRRLDACHQSELSALLGAAAAAEKRRCCAACTSDLLQLFATPRMRTISLACFCCLFVDGLVSYGIVEDAPQLGGNAYTALLLSGGVGLLANATCVLLGGALGRRLTVIAAQLATALVSLALLAVPASADWARLALAMAARCTVSAGLNVLAFYSAELFPTTIRSTGFSVGATVSRLGAVLAPVVVAVAGRAYWGAPAAAFGACTLAAGAAAMCLPETQGRRLPETVNDVEAE